MFDPALMIVGPLFVTRRSALVATVAVVVDVSLALFESFDALTFAVFTMLLPFAASASMATTIVIVADAPSASVPSAQVTVAVPEQFPCAGVADTNEVLGGSTSETDTFAASDGPALVTVSV